MDEKQFVKLTYSVFTDHPTVVFSKNMKVPVAFWDDLWRRYTMLEYKPSDLKDWFELKIKKEISEKTIRRYIIRQELFNRGQLMLRKGEKIVHIRHFTKHQEYLKPYIITL